MSLDINKTKLPDPNSSETIRYYQYANFILDELTYIKSAFDLYIHIYNKRTKPEELGILNISPAFWGMTTNALLNSSIIKLCKLYDSDNKAITINKFINYVSSNKHKIFNKDDISEIEKLITNDSDLLKTKKTYILKLKELRDKNLAHNDIKLFQTESNIWKEIDLKIEDFHMLMNICGDVINNYASFSDKTQHMIQATNYLDVERTLNFIRRSKLIAYKDSLKA